MSTRVICQSYLGHYSLAGLMYLNGFDERFPDDPSQWLFTRASINPDHPLACRWHDQELSPQGPTMQSNPAYQGVMWPYLNATSLSPCPEFRRHAPARGCQNESHPRSLDIVPQLSYSINGYLGSDQPGGVRTADQVRDPAEVFFFAEENSWTVPTGTSKLLSKRRGQALSTRPWDDTVLMIRPVPKVENCFATYHGVSRDKLDRGSAFVAFIDGHVDSISYEDQLTATGRSSIRSQAKSAGNLAWAWADKSPLPDSITENNPGKQKR